MRTLVFVLCAILFLLTGCASVRPLAENAMASGTAATEEFAFSARLAVQQEEKLYHANLHWQHTAIEDEILVTGPFGQGIAELRRNADGASLRTGKREQLAANWDELAHEAFAAPIPVSELPAWLRGQAPKAEKDAHGRPHSLQQQGWKIDWLEYESEAANARPTLIELHGNGISVRLKISEWEKVEALEKAETQEKSP